MTAITIFNGLFCDADSVVKKVVDITGYRLVSDQEIIADAARLSGISEEKIAKMFLPREALVGQRLPRSNEIISWLRLAMANRLSERQDLVLNGYTALLPPLGVKHVLKVCLVSEIKERLMVAKRDRKYSKKSARNLIRADDQIRTDWVMALTNGNDPWNKNLYDILIPIEAVGIRQSAFLVVEQLANVAVQGFESSREDLNDFLLAAKVQAALSHKGHSISVSARQGDLTLSFNNHEQLLQNVARELCEFVSRFDGVKNVQAGVGRAYNQGDVYNRARFQNSSGNSREGAVHDGKVTTHACDFPGNQTDDFVLAAKVQAALARDGHNVFVCAQKGSLSLTINDHKMMVKNMARGLCDFVSQFDGVKNVEIGIGEGYHQTATYRSIRQRNASRLLLVDDEREFVQILSERLQMRGIGSISVHDGETALNAVRKNEPELMILDVDMPGLDGIEVLRQVKRDHPKVEVLILTGRGSEADRDVCLDLGAFAYLHKPVNIDTLSNTIRGANEKIRCTTS